MTRLYPKRKAKGSTPVLPERRALNKLTAGDAFQRSISNYAKVTPSGDKAIGLPNVLDMAQIKY